MWVWSVGQEDHLEKGMATLSSILAWRIPWTEEPGGLHSTWPQRVGHDWRLSKQPKCSLTAEALFRWWTMGSVWEGQQRTQQTQHLMELTFYNKCGMDVRNSWEAAWPHRFVLNLTGLHSIKMKRIDQFKSHLGATSGLEPRLTWSLVCADLIRQAQINWSMSLCPLQLDFAFSDSCFMV